MGGVFGCLFIMAFGLLFWAAVYVGLAQLLGWASAMFAIVMAGLIIVGCIWVWSDFKNRHQPHDPDSNR